MHGTAHIAHTSRSPQKERGEREEERERVRNARNERAKRECVECDMPKQQQRPVTANSTLFNTSLTQQIRDVSRYEISDIIYRTSLIIENIANFVIRLNISEFFYYRKYRKYCQTFL